MDSEQSHWYAIRVYRRASERLEAFLSDNSEEVFVPRRKVRTEGGRMAERDVVSGLMFVRLTPAQVQAFEHAHSADARLQPFTLYRNIAGTRAQPIDPADIRLMRLITEGADYGGVEFFELRGRDFRPGDLVRVVGGEFAGTVGHLKRFKNLSRVIIELNNSWSVILPFVPHSYLERLPADGSTQ